MASTGHASAVEQAVEGILEDDPAYASVLYDVLAKLRGGFYGPDSVDCVMQKGQYARTYDLHDALAFSWFRTELFRGLLGAVSIEVGREPFPDREVEANNDALSDLPAPFRAHFVGAKNDEDGRLAWSEPVVMTRNLSRGPGKILAQHVIVQPRCVPLEVGTTAGSRSILHIMQDRGLARWPYGHGRITAYVRLTDDEIATAWDLEDDGI